MRLTTFTDYSLRVLIYVATTPDRRTTIAEVARAFGISENHLVKVVHFLGKAGLLANVRGRGGGLELAMPATAVNIGQVIRLSEAGDVPAECFNRDSNTCPITSNCRLRAILGEAVQSFYAVLEKYSLQDLVRNRTALGKILFLQTRAPARSRS
jgi:Rrf2 family transcriptional regulator, nitric oxide-sensitive transcriptional repressor